MVNITIDGTAVGVEEGTTVLEAAHRSGIHIPTLCYHRALGPRGACRLCIVEAEGPSLERTIATSCNLIASEGYVVETETPVIIEMRKTILGLLFPEAISTSVLASIASGKESSVRLLNLAGAAHCALCGQCVQVCRDIIGAAALSFNTAGDNRNKVIEYIYFSKKDCIGCGTCARVCPTGVITVEDRGPERLIFRDGNEINRVRLIGCEHCGSPVATETFINSVRYRLSGHPDARFKNLCPECARIRYAMSVAEGMPAQILNYPRCEPEVNASHESMRDRSGRISDITGKI